MLLDIYYLEKYYQIPFKVKKYPLNPIKVYGDNTITSKDKAVIRRMAAYIGVSYTALVIRLRDMGLFEYHNILEYISNELNLGGVSQ